MSSQRATDREPVLEPCKRILVYLPDDGTDRRLIGALRREMGVSRVDSVAVRAVGVLQATRKKGGRVWKTAHMLRRTCGKPIRNLYGRRFVKRAANWRLGSMPATGCTTLGRQQSEHVYARSVSGENIKVPCQARRRLNAYCVLPIWCAIGRRWKLRSTIHICTRQRRSN